MYVHLGRGKVGEKCEADHSFEQEINVQNMNTELVAQMFKNYQSNVLFHLEGVSFSFPSLHYRNWKSCIGLTEVVVQLRRV